MSDHLAEYPCPACGATATTTGPCPGCGRAPDPDAALVVQLNADMIRLTAAEAAARKAHADAFQALMQTRTARDEAAARVRVSVGRSAPAPGYQPPAYPSAPVPAPDPRLAPAGPVPVVGAPESSPRTVQNLLFVIGGILLGTAAIVFTAVAWVNFTVVGRAAILGVATAILLAIPLIARRRGLTGTAETFVALGLLFVVLDGYAAWKVDFNGLNDRLVPERYAAGVFAVTGLIAAAYWAGTKLKAALISGGLALQPVLPLAIAPLRPGIAGWAGVAVGMAAANIGVLWARGRRRDVFAIVVSCIIGGWWLIALPLLIGGAAVSDGAGSHRITIDLVAAGLVWALWAYVTRTAAPAGIAGLVTLIEVALLRDIAVAEYRFSVLLVAAVIAAPLLAFSLRPGGSAVLAGRITAIAFAGGYAMVMLGFALEAAGRLVGRAIPWWAATGGVAVRHTWELPVAAAIVAAVAVATTRGRWRWFLGIATVPIVSLLAIVSVSLPWWGPIAVVGGTAVLVLALVSALRPATAGMRATATPIAGFLLVLTILGGFARPAGTLAVAIGLLVAGVAVAWLDRERTGAPGVLATVVACIGVPLAGLAAPRVAGYDGGFLGLRGAAAATVLGTAVWCVLARSAGRFPSWYRWAGSATLLVAINAIGVAPIFDVGDEPAAIYAAGAIAVAVALILVCARELWPGGTPVFLAALATLLPGAASVLIQPYAWASDVWSGRPTGPGLAPDGQYSGRLSDPIAWLLVGVAVAGLVQVLWKRWRIALLFAFYPVALALLTLLAGQEAAWPAVPAAALGVGIVAALWSARIAHGSSLAGLFGAAVFGGAAMAGALPTKPSTLAALSLIVVTAVVAAGMARTDFARIAATVTAAVSTLTLGLVAPIAADESIHVAAFGILGAAAVLLAAGFALRRRKAEALVLTLAAHAGAVVAFLLSLPRLSNAAAVAVLWAIALGVRALLPAAARAANLVGAGFCLLLAWWLSLASQGIGLYEAYTGPLALVALAAGVFLGRERTNLSSWQRYGVALVAGFLPSLAQIMFTYGDPWRRLLLGVAGVVVLLLGARLRLRALFVTASVVLILIAVHEIVLLWDRLPRWIPLGVAGLIVITAAIRYEWTRSRMTELRHKVAEMT